MPPDNKIDKRYAKLAAKVKRQRDRQARRLAMSDERIILLKCYHDAIKMAKQCESVKRTESAKIFRKMAALYLKEFRKLA